MQATVRMVAMTRTKETTTMMITVWKVSSSPAYNRKK